MTQTPEQPEPTPATEADTESAPAGATTIQPVLIGFVLATIIGAITLATFWSH